MTAPATAPVYCPLCEADLVEDCKPLGFEPSPPVGLPRPCGEHREVFEAAVDAYLRALAGGAR